MESDLKMYLEFYGLPGCGKSTISHSLAEMLRSGGKEVYEPTYDSDHRKNPIIRKICKGSNLLKFIIVHPKKWKSLNTLIKKNGNTGRTASSLGANIVSKLSYYNKEYSGYVVLDEGITQSSISLVNAGITAAENEKALYGLCATRNVKKIYVKVTSDTALARMSERDVHDSRIEKIADPAERKTALQSFERECETIVPDLILEDLSVEDAVDTIMRQLI